MKVLLCLLVALAFTQAKHLNWEPRNIHVPSRGFNLLNLNDGRIANGQEAPPHAFPYQASLVSNVGSCGGSLISNRVVLTAAHCVKSATDILVILGAHNRFEEEPTQIRQWCTEFVVHSEWNRPVRFANDIALIFLPEPVEFTAEISPISLPTRKEQNKDFSRYPGRVSGWGKTLNGEGATPNLQYTDTHIISNEECKNSYQELILDSTLCIFSGNQTTCQGDSGGPLVTYDDSRFIQVGVVSFGSVTCGYKQPQAFARVTEYLDWIEKNSDIIIH